MPAVRRAVGAVCGQGDGLYAKAGLGPLQHCTRSDFRLTNGPRRLDVDNHAMLGIDQVVIGIGEEGVSLVCACPLRRSIGSRDEFRRHGRGGSERRVVESGEVFLRGSDQS